MLAVVPPDRSCATAVLAAENASVPGTGCVARLPVMLIAVLAIAPSVAPAPADESVTVNVRVP